MPSNYNPNEINHIALRLSRLGVDSQTLWQDEDRNEKCTLGWQDLRVTGTGLPGQIGAAMEDAERKIRAAIVEKYPSVELPPPHV